MSVHAISWAYRTPEDLDTYEAFILVTLADQADDYGICWALNRTLQEKCRCGSRKVIMALQRLQDLGLILQVHRRRPNGSQKSSVFILIGWPDRKLATAMEEHPTLQQLNVEGLEDLATIRVHVVQSAEDVDKPVDKPMNDHSADCMSCTTPLHDMQDPPARHAPLEPSIEPKKEPLPEPRVSSAPDQRLVERANLIRKHLPYLTRSMSAQSARECISAGLVSLDDCRRAGISV